MVSYEKNMNTNISVVYGPPMDDLEKQITIDAELYKKADAIYSLIGMDIKSAVELFLKQTVLQQGLPLKMKVSSKEEPEKRTRDRKIKKE